jgi:hypothetical protein
MTVISQIANWTSIIQDSVEDGPRAPFLVSTSSKNVGMLFTVINKINKHMCSKNPEEEVVVIDLGLRGHDKHAAAKTSFLFVGSSVPF